MKLSIFALGILVLFGIGGCTNQQEEHRVQSLESEVAALKKTVEDLKPGLGEIMATIHLHHAKLYYAGKSENWDLASYQLDEIKEGLDAATELHEHFKELKTSLKELRHMTDSGMAAIEKAIQEKSKPHFMDGFQKLTTSCNQCHQAAEHGFIVIQTPSVGMFTNQKFETEKKL